MRKLPVIVELVWHHDNVKGLGGEQLPIMQHRLASISILTELHPTSRMLLAEIHVSVDRLNNVGMLYWNERGMSELRSLFQALRKVYVRENSSVSMLRLAKYDEFVRTMGKSKFLDADNMAHIPSASDVEKLFAEEINATWPSSYKVAKLVSSPSHTVLLSL